MKKIYKPILPVKLSVRQPDAVMLQDAAEVVFLDESSLVQVEQTENSGAGLQVRAELSGSRQMINRCGKTADQRASANITTL